MSYKKVLSYIQYLVTGEVTVYIGRELSGLVKGTAKDGVYKVSDTTLDFISIAIGIAMTTDKRVYVVCDDNYLFRHLNKFVQASVSRCNNLFFIILVTRNYSPILKQVNLFDSVSSVKGAIYEMGFLTHIYTRFFQNKQELKKLKELIQKAVGPAIGFVDVDNTKKLKLNDISNDTQLFVDFVRYRKQEAALVDPEAVELRVKE